MPLMRGRELKRHTLKLVVYYNQDAPYAGARIETEVTRAKGEELKDAPYAGARIETPFGYSLYSRLCDAPYAGARIETE